jgi:SAM-dependent methyltransferase
VSQAYSAEYYRRNYVNRGPALIADFGSQIDRLRPHLSGSRWLDVGCGGGYFARAALDRGWQVTGVDPSADAIALAKSLAPQAHLVQGTAEDLPPDARFDVISFWDCVAYIPDLPRTLPDYLAHLAPGGTVVVKTPHLPARFHRVVHRVFWWRPALRNALAWVMKARWHFTPASLGAVLKSHGLEVVSERWVEEVPDGGRPGSLKGVLRKRVERWLRRAAIGRHESFVLVARKPGA